MKHVLITGGSNGLGRLTAQKLIEAGYRVTILSQRKEKTSQVAKELGCAYVVADVSDYMAVQTVIKQTGKIDVLINNAGIWIQGPLEENDPIRMKKVMEVNALGAMYCTQAVIPQMKARKSGRIINISSQGGLYAKAERGVYTASKWALTGFTKAIQAELKPFNISVVGMYPGGMNHQMGETDIFTKAGNKRDMSKALDMEIVANAIVYVCDLPDGINVPEFGVENLAY